MVYDNFERSPDQVMPEDGSQLHGGCVSVETEGQAENGKCSNGWAQQLGLEPLEGRLAFLSPNSRLALLQELAERGRLL